MKKAVLGIGLVLMLLLVGQAAAQSNGEVLFEADFNNGRIPSDINVTEGWSVVKQGRDVMLHGESTDFETLDIQGGADWSNYALEARLRITKGVVYLNGRVADDFCRGYGVAIFPDESILDLVNLDKDCKTTILGSVEDFKVDPARWMTVRLEMVGDKLAVLVDGEVVISARDSTYTQGFPVIYLVNEAVVDFDSIQAVFLEDTGTVVPTTITLVDYAGTPERAIAELQRLKLVPSGGQLLFREPSAFFQGTGNWFTPLARRSPRTNVVMAGELTLRSGAPNEIELCSLSSRLKTDSNNMATSYVDVGIANTGELVIRDYPTAGSSATTFEVLPLKLSLETPNHLLIILIGNKISVFVNGELVADQLDAVERSGSFGIGLISKGRNSRCDGKNIWVYQFD